MATLKAICARGCGRMAISGSSLCATCRASSDARRQARRRKYNHRRGTSQERGYDAAWRRVRGAYIKAHPTCEFDGCSAAAQEVDHVVPIRDGGARLSWSNLRSACKHHHSRRTAADHRGPGGRFGGGEWIPQEEFERTWREIFYPRDLPKPDFPVTIVCGPPGAGICCHRIRRSGERIEGVKRWWRRYKPREGDRVVS